MNINLGCQIHYFDGWINQDIVVGDPNVKVDLNCNANSLPYDNDTVDFIYAGHLLEHFYPDTVLSAVREWYRVLKPGGTLIIVVPDCGEVFKSYAKREITIEQVWQQIYGRIYEYDRDSERHHIAFDREQLIDMVGEWYMIEDLNFHNVPVELEPFMDTHISRGIYQLGIILTK